MDSPVLTPVLYYLAGVTGIALPETLYQPVERFVNERCRFMECGVEDYIAALARDRQEFYLFIDAVTVNETYFFREEAQFRLLEEILLPQLAAKLNGIKIWSASCSTGEEALSLYGLAGKVFGSERVYVAASDINNTSLDYFNRGIYRSNSFRQDGAGYHNMVKGMGRVRDDVLFIDRHILDTIDRFQVNLNDLPDERLPSDFSLIFFRNTIIYFTLEERQAIVSGIIHHLKEGGFLFASVTEAALVAHPDLALEENRGIYFFRKKSLSEKTEGVSVQVVFPVESSQEVPLLNDPTEPLHGIDTHTILMMANQKLHNRHFSLPLNENYGAALLLVEALFFLNTNDCQSAEKIIKRFEKIGTLQEITWYLKARCCVIDTDIHGAVDACNRCLYAAEHFWPGRFLRAKLLFDNNEHDRARTDYDRLIVDVNRYIDNGDYSYQIFMDGFNGKYFLKICEGFAKKLSARG